MAEHSCVVGIFAHPDDEAFSVAGVFRKYHDAGIRTALICATRGEDGQISDPALATRESLGMVREDELRRAAAIMGVDDLTFLDYHDGRVAQAPVVEIVGRIVAQIRRLRPQVVVTFDANGGYGHPDHMAIHRATWAAFEQAGDASRYPEQVAAGLAPYAPRKLYAGAFSRSMMRRLGEEAGIAFQITGDVATIPPEEMGTADERITTRIPLTEALFDTKMRAMQAHATQQDPNGLLAQLPPRALETWLSTETFVRLVPAARPGDATEDDLFAGITE